MKKTFLFLALSLAGTSAASADGQSTLPFMRDLAAGHDLPRPYGIGIDVFTMHQDYGISSLVFALPGVVLPDPSVISVKNQIVHTDIKADAWLFPFLNVFGVLGKVTAQTDVNLSSVILPFPVSLGTLPVKYDGNVYGGGFTLAYGGERWFTSLTATWTKTSLSGDFDSSVKAHSLQPRIGLVNGPWQIWAGAMDLHTEESHVGTIELPVIGPVPFEVTLQEKTSWSPTAGVRYELDRFADVTFEVGGGDRRTTLLNVNFRFPRDDN